ncbi:MAG: glycosyltransferase [Acidobacteria bacterium]|nr:glycosyltransferase [Acidobacteriota bacterium]
MDRKLNILQVCDHLGWEGSRMHGVKRLFAWMIPRFDPDRFNVSLVSLRKKDVSEETLDALGVDITYLHKAKFDPSTLPGLLKVIDRKAIDILHMHGYGATTFGRLAGAVRRIPTILHEHANLTDTPWFQKIADRVLEPYTDIAIAVSRSTADFVAGARLVRPEKVKVVYLGVPLEEFSRPRSAHEIAAARQELGIAPADFAIGTVTRLHDSKGNAYLVDAAREVLNERPHAKFFLAGEGPLRGDLEAQAARLNLGDRLVFTGFLRDVGRALAAFDLKVFPSLWEGTPLTVFEALAMGKAIVATDADGLTDVLTHGHDAVIVPRRDAPALARTIVWAMDRPAERDRLAENARMTGRRYDIGAFVRKMERLYGILHEVSRPTKRRGVLETDLSYLTGGAAACPQRACRLRALTSRRAQPGSGRACWRRSWSCSRMPVLRCQSIFRARRTASRATRRRTT